MVLVPQSGQYLAQVETGCKRTAGRTTLSHGEWWPGADFGWKIFLWSYHAGGREYDGGGSGLSRDLVDGSALVFLLRPGASARRSASGGWVSCHVQSSGQGGRDRGGYNNVMMRHNNVMKIYMWGYNGNSSILIGKSKGK